MKKVLFTLSLILVFMGFGMFAFPAKTHAYYSDYQYYYDSGYTYDDYDGGYYQDYPYSYGYDYFLSGSTYNPHYPTGHISVGVSLQKSTNSRSSNSYNGYTSRTPQVPTCHRYCSY
jgi:hypothetical protein